MRHASGNRILVLAVAVVAMSLFSALGVSCSDGDEGVGSPLVPGQDVPGTDQPSADGTVEVSPCTSECGGMVSVPAGSFRMGCVAGGSVGVCDPGEMPSHAVEVPAFEIDVTEATVDLWFRCVEAGGCTLPNTSSMACSYGRAGRGQYPINCIKQPQAGAFCLWGGKRLCTEAEWEKAAVGTEGRLYPWGDQTPTCALAVLDEGGFGCGTDDAFPVGSRPAGDTPAGLKDMAGNVLEWVADDHHDSYTDAPADGAAWMVPPTQLHVARGGAYSDKSPLMRAAARHAFNRQLDGYYLGVRCCR